MVEEQSDSRDPPCAGNTHNHTSHCELNFGVGPPTFIGGNPPIDKDTVLADKLSDPVVFVAQTWVHHRRAQHRMDSNSSANTVHGDAVCSQPTSIDPYLLQTCMKHLRTVGHRLAPKTWTAPTDASGTCTKGWPSNTPQVERVSGDRAHVRIATWRTPLQCTSSTPCECCCNLMSRTRRNRTSQASLQGPSIPSIGCHRKPRVRMRLNCERQRHIVKETNDTNMIRSIIGWMIWTLHTVSDDFTNSLNDQMWLDGLGVGAEFGSIPAQIDQPFS